MAPSRVLATVSGLMNGVLMFTFSCAFAAIIFTEHPELAQYTSVGVGMHTYTVLVGGMSFALFSGSAASIAGPDITPQLFFADMARVLVTRMGNSTLSDSSSTVLPTPERILPTLLVAIIVGTALTGILFIMLGTFRLTRMVQYMPASLLCGFLACVGYKVLVYTAIPISTGRYKSKPWSLDFWRLLLPAMVLGLLIWYTKRNHLGSTAVVLPVLLFGPLLAFYVGLFATGTTLQDASEQGWLLVERYESRPFYDVWLELDMVAVDGGSLWACLSPMVMLLTLSTVDFLIQLAGTKRSLDMPGVTFDGEIRLAGYTNLFTAATCGVPAYSQMKFTLLNHGITATIHDKMPAIMCAVINGVLFFFGGDLIIKYLPRFYLGGLLVYAGLGFVVQNLYDKRNQIAREEFVAIWIIVIINAGFGLAVAVGSGMVLAAVIFVLAYQRIGVIRVVLDGNDYESKVVRSEAEQRKLDHLSSRFTIIELHHYIFFGSASQCLDLARDMIDIQTEELAKAGQRLQQCLADDDDGIDSSGSALAAAEAQRNASKYTYLVWDFRLVDGIDFSGIGVFLELVKILHKHGIQLVFTGMRPSVESGLATEGVFTYLAAVFPHLDHGVEWVQGRLLDWAFQVRLRWLVFKPLRKYHELAILRAKHDAFEAALQGVGDEVWKYVHEHKLNRGEVLILPDSINEVLYVVQSGAVCSYQRNPDGSRTRICRYSRGAFVNEFSMFVHIKQPYMIAADLDNTILLGICKASMEKMELHDPELAFAIQRTVMRRFWQSTVKLEREIFDYEEENRETVNLKPKNASVRGQGTRFFTKNSSSLSQNNAIGRSKSAQINAGRQFRSNHLLGKSMYKPKPAPSQVNIIMHRLSDTHKVGNAIKLAAEMIKAADPSQQNVSNDDKLSLSPPLSDMNGSGEGHKVRFASIRNRRRASFTVQLDEAENGSKNDPTLLGDKVAERHRLSASETRGGIMSMDLSELGIESVVETGNDSDSDSDNSDNGERNLLRNHRLKNDGDFAPVDGTSFQLPTNMQRDIFSCFLFHEVDGMGSLEVSDALQALRDLGHYLDRGELLEILQTSCEEGLVKLPSIGGSAAIEGKFQGNASSHLNINGAAGDNIKARLQIKSMLISSVPLLSQFDNATIDELSRVSHECTFQRGDFLCVQGCSGKSLVIVVEGRVLVYRDGQRPKTLRRSNLNEACFLLGEMALFNAENQECLRTCNVVADSNEVVTLHISKDDLFDIIPPRDTRWDGMYEQVRILEAHDRIRGHVQTLPAFFFRHHSGSVANDRSHFKISERSILPSVVAKAHRRKGTVEARGSSIHGGFGRKFEALSTHLTIFLQISEGNPSILTKLASASELRTYVKGDILCFQGERGDRMIAVIEGEVAVFTNDNTGEKRVLKPRQDIVEISRSRPFSSLLRRRKKREKRRKSSLTASSKYNSHVPSRHKHSLGHGHHHPNCVLIGESGLSNPDVVRNANCVAMSPSVITLELPRENLVAIFDPSHSIWNHLEERAELYADFDELNLENSKRQEGEPAVPYFGGEGVSAKIMREGRRLSSVFHLDTALGSPQSNAIESRYSISAAVKNPSGGAGSTPAVLSRSATSRRKEVRIVAADFQRIVRALRLAPLSKSQIQRLKDVFCLYAGEPQMAMPANQVLASSLSSIPNIEASKTLELNAEKESGKEMKEHASEIEGEQEQSRLGPKLVLTLSKLRRLMSDSGQSATMSNVELERTMRKWATMQVAAEQTDLTTASKITYIPALCLNGFLSMMSYMQRKEELGDEVENLYAQFLGHDKMCPKLRRDVMVGVRGITITDIRRLWRRARGEDLSLATAAEMMFEADVEGFGELSLEAWLDTLRSLHDSELTISSTVAQTRR